MRIVIATLLSAVLVACNVYQTPPPGPPPDGPGTCGSACRNLDRLGCGLGPDCLDLCEQTMAAEADVGERLPVGCLTAAETCDAAALCR